MMHHPKWVAVDSDRRQVLHGGRGAKRYVAIQASSEVSSTSEVQSCHTEPLADARNEAAGTAQFAKIAAQNPNVREMGQPA